MTRTAKKSARFRSMTKAEQRVAIARDALAWIEAGALIPQRNVYFQPAGDDGIADASERYSTKQARNVRFGRCRVCALGAVMVAKAVRFNVTAELLSMQSANAYRQNLVEFFDDEQLRLIEHAFECWAEWRPEARAYGRRFRSDRARLAAILQNIIDNGGTFRPEASP